MKIEKGKMQNGRMGDVTRLREKNLANMADKKKTLEITALFCRVLVRQMADKESRSECRITGRMKNTTWTALEVEESSQCKNRWRS
jgi:hypothetical protein